jgi:glycine/D-amino acid oxidase-like deaminating enzyme
MTGQPDAEAAANWALVNAPLGEPWSGRTRYAAAMYFYKRGEMDAETLEVYRICSRLDREDPLPIIRDRGVGKGWLARMQAR